MLLFKFSVDSNFFKSYLNQESLVVSSTVDLYLSSVNEVKILSFSEWNFA